MKKHRARGRVSFEAGVKMREEPSTEAAVLLTLPRDEIVDVIGEADNWLKISFEGQNGYVPARFIAETTDRPRVEVAAGSVFISYERRSREYVDRLSDYLKGHGVSCWFDEHIGYGADWATLIREQIEAAACMIVVMTREAGASKWVKLEIELAEERRIPILPLLAEADGAIEALRHLQFGNVMDGSMPPLAFCQNLPGFLVNERDVMNVLTDRQREIARKIARSIGGIRRGARGMGVAVLQAELTRIGLDPGPIDGEYGDKTLHALREFQRRRYPKATIDGMLGPITAAVLINSSLGDLA